MSIVTWFQHRPRLPAKVYTHNMKKVLIVIGIVVALTMVYFFVATPAKEDVFKNGERITHTYQISADKKVLIDNWDCGATCASHTYVYLQTRKEKKLLFSCEHVPNIELSDFTATSAKISKIDGDGTSCRYKEGDVINF
jgi:hypothetical protein